MKRLGVFGGTFNPFHKGHEIAAAQFYDIMELDELLIIPTNIPPHKQVDMSVSAEERLAMCRIAFANEERNISVSDIEINKNSVSYSYDTLTALKKQYPEYTIYFLIGSDMFRYLDKWYKYRDLFSLCTFVVAERYSNDVSEDIEELAQFYRKTENASVELIKIDFLEISSTQIRYKIRNNDNVLQYLAQDIYTYIREKGLYKR